MYNILIETGIVMKLVRLIKIFLNENRSEVRIGKKPSHHILPRSVLILFFHIHLRLPSNL
jgi:hypothetical protein